MFQKIRPVLYEFSARRALLFRSKRKFMNLGYEEEKETRTEVGPVDKPDTHHILLYRKLLDRVPLLKQSAKNISVLEIGCGRGGGCYVMRNYFNLTEITAIDLSAANIKLAQRLVPGVAFYSGNAATFRSSALYDLVLNLESSHAYPSREDFFRTVSKVLRPGGYFAFGDLVRKSALTETEEFLTETGFKILYSENLNAGVIRSIEKNSRRQYPIASRFPYLFPKKIHGFLVTTHSIPFKLLCSKEVLYQVYVAQKV